MRCHRVALVVIAAAAFASCAYYRDDAESRILAVGIDEYTQVRDLGACVSDAQAIAAAAAVDSRVVIAGNAGSATVTKNTVLTAIAEAAVSAPSGGYDVFIFHYSGHGSEVMGGILAMGDTPYPPVADRVITVTELLTAVAAVPAAVRVVILDSCNSGFFVDEGSDVSTLPGEDPFSFTELVAEAASRYDEAAGGDLIVMSAAGADELSQEFVTPTLAHGYFTMGLLESVKHGDEDGDGLVTLTEAYDYAARYVATVFNDANATAAYYPRISGSALDVVLFTAQDE